MPYLKKLFLRKYFRTMFLNVHPWHEKSGDRDEKGSYLRASESDDNLYYYYYTEEGASTVNSSEANFIGIFFKFKWQKYLLYSTSKTELINVNQLFITNPLNFSIFTWFVEHFCILKISPNVSK